MSVTQPSGSEASPWSMSFDADDLPLPRPGGTQALKDSSFYPSSHHSFSVLPHISLQEGWSASSMSSLTSRLTDQEMAKSPRLKDPDLGVEWRGAHPESSLPGQRLMLTAQLSLWMGDSWNEILPPGPHSVC